MSIKESKELQAKVQDLINFCAEHNEQVLLTFQDGLEEDSFFPTQTILVTCLCMKPEAAEDIKNYLFERLRLNPNKFVNWDEE